MSEQTSRTTVSSGVEGFSGPGRKHRISPNANEWGSRVPVPSRVLPELGSGDSNVLRSSGLGGFGKGSPKSTGTTGELGGGLAHAMYQGVCAGLQG